MRQITTNCVTNEIVKWTLLQERSVDICGRDIQGLTEFKTSRHDVDKTGGHRHHKAKTVSTRPRGRSSILWMKQTTSDWQTWTSGVGARNDTLYWSRSDGRQPSCNHPLRTPNQITSGCKVKNYIHGSVTAQTERKPQASEKRRRSLPSQDILKVSPKAFKFNIFFLPWYYEDSGTFSWNEHGENSSDSELQNKKMFEVMECVLRKELMELVQEIWISWLRVEW